MSACSTPPATLRTTTDDDTAFLFTLYASTRREEFAHFGWSAPQTELFLKMQFNAQQRSYRGAFPQADRSIILLHGEPAGAMTVNRGTDEIRLVNIALLPEHRAVGIGARLLNTLIEEATERAVPLRLSVAKTNRAARLYVRRGFAVTGDDGVYWSMDWTRPFQAPPNPSAP
jgi:ribosomal protein S18 acetylase RimI-like enzyme